MSDKRRNPSNYALVVLSEGAQWEGYKVQEYGEPDAYGHRKKASVAETLSTEIQAAHQRRNRGQRSHLRPARRRSGFHGQADLVHFRHHGFRSDAGGPERFDGGHSTKGATHWFRCPIRSSAHADWTWRPCITPPATGPTTPVSWGCRCFSRGRKAQEAADAVFSSDPRVARDRQQSSR